MTDEKKINELVQEELKAMCIKHNHEKFNSPHEAYAVTREEMEETIDDIEMMSKNFSLLWSSIKEDNAKKSNWIDVKDFAVMAIQELIQVAACCDKAVR